MKTVLITGAARGIGRATAILCGSRGWSVAVNYVSERLKRMFEVNVYGAYLCAREAARRLPTNRGGAGRSIVLASSKRTFMPAAASPIERNASEPPRRWAAREERRKSRRQSSGY